MFLCFCYSDTLKPQQDQEKKESITNKNNTFEKIPPKKTKRVTPRFHNSAPFFIARSTSTIQILFKGVFNE